MPIDFYHVLGSAPCRAVHLAAKAVGVDLTLHPVNLVAGEQLAPEFIKMNPQHTVPTINDNGFCLWESRAIMSYFADQYGKNDALYPKDPKKRAMVDQRMQFDLGTLYIRFADYYYPVMFAGGAYEPAKLTRCEDAFQFLETFLTTTPYAAGDSMTLADLTLLATVTTFEAVGFNVAAYPKVSAWMAKMKAEAPGHEEANGKGMEAFKQLFENCTKAK